MFKVVYLWRGERHVTCWNESKAECAKVAQAMRLDGWQAWVERNREASADAL